jgi:hypothetical protein
MENDVSKCLTMENDVSKCLQCPNKRLCISRELAIRLLEELNECVEDETKEEDKEDEKENTKDEEPVEEDDNPNNDNTEDPVTEPSNNCEDYDKSCEELKQLCDETKENKWCEVYKHKCLNCDSFKQYCQEPTENTPTTENPQKPIPQDPQKPTPNPETTPPNGTAPTGDPVQEQKDCYKNCWPGCDVRKGVDQMHCISDCHTKCSNPKEECLKLCRDQVCAKKSNVAQVQEICEINCVATCSEYDVLANDANCPSEFYFAGLDCEQLPEFKKWYGRIQLMNEGDLKKEEQINYAKAVKDYAAQVEKCLEKHTFPGFAYYPGSWV